MTFYVGIKLLLNGRVLFMLFSKMLCHIELTSGKTMKKLQFKTIFLVATLFLLAACSSKPKTPLGPVDDEYITEPFVWDDNKSEALNLLRSADLQKYFKDVDSADDFDEVRYRKSTAKSVFDYVGGFMAFGIGGALNNNANHENDDNPKFKLPTYVTYIPVDKQNLTIVEQTDVRDKAVERFSALVNAKDLKRKPYWAFRSESRYVLSKTGEACSIVGDAYKNSKVSSPCALSVYVKVSRIIKAKEAHFLPEADAKWFAVVTVAIASPYTAIVAAKNVDQYSFIAFLDVSKTFYTYIKTLYPVVVSQNKILSFLNPRKKPTVNLPSKKLETVVCVRDTGHCSTVFFTASDEPIEKYKVVTK